MYTKNHFDKDKMISDVSNRDPFVLNNCLTYRFHISVLHVKKSAPSGPLRTRSNGPLNAQKMITAVRVWNITHSFPDQSMQSILYYIVSWPSFFRLTASQSSLSALSVTLDLPKT